MHVTPPRAPDPAHAAACSEDEYDAVVGEMAVVQGQINAAEARMVALAARAMELGAARGDGLRPERWMACRTGAAPGRAAGTVRLARRSAELPATLAALGSGELSLDQAIEIAKHVPARYEASAARVAPFCTVAQLRTTLRHYRDPKPDPDRAPRRHVRTGFDDDGYWADVRLPEAEGAVFDQALKATWEDLKRQVRTDGPETDDPPPVTLADAVVALAATALEVGAGAHPGTDRYLVHVHLEAGPHGLALATHLGIAIPEPQRRRILCDANLAAVLHDAETGAPLNAGRSTRHINRRLRRAIEHRDRGCCTVPGCGRTSGLEIHHIVHWEDGGPTDTANPTSSQSAH